MKADFEEDQELASIRKIMDQVSNEISVMKCEQLRLIRPEYQSFVEKHGLQQFDRLKRPGLQKISKIEISVYATLKGISIRKATIIVRQFNRYIATMRLNREPSDTIAWLIAEPNLN